MRSRFFRRDPTAHFDKEDRLGGMGSSVRDFSDRIQLPTLIKRTVLGKWVQLVSRQVEFRYCQAESWQMERNHLGSPPSLENHRARQSIHTRSWLFQYLGTESVVLSQPSRAILPDHLKVYHEIPPRQASHRSTGTHQPYAGSEDLNLSMKLPDLVLLLAVWVN